MSNLELFTDAAVRDLVLALASARKALPGCRVAQETREPPSPPPKPTPSELGAVESLARKVVQTILEVSGRELNHDLLAATVERAVREELAQCPSLNRTLLARLAAETPQLINLPLLARLARNGLDLSPAAVAGAWSGQSIVGGDSPSFSQALKDLAMVAETDFAVMLCGETGTGKELMARQLHQMSPRRAGPFIALNCAGVAPDLLESELFGHVKGAFTGAHTAQRGYVAAAQGGTLFLDEIGETRPRFQVRLLRVVEDRMVVPVGSHKGKSVDFRVVTATNRDLDALAQKGEFNRSLLYRLKVVPVSLPPLRERWEDLPALIQHFLTQACSLARREKTLSPRAKERLLRYSWPGNAREMSHVLQRMVALSSEIRMGLQDLPPELTTGGGPGEDDALSSRLAAVPGIAPERMDPLARLLARSRGRMVRNKDLREVLACSDTTAKNILKALARSGLIQAQGQRGGRRYLVIESEED